MYDIYVDGSWKPSKPNIAGWAVAIFENNTAIHTESGVIECISRQVDGELYATLRAVALVRNMNIDKFNLHYDYVGIKAWVTGEWSAKSEIAKAYVEELYNYMDIVNNITFIKVNSHTNTSKENDLVDYLAKREVDMY